MKFCGICGSKLDDNARFCANCGEPCHDVPNSGTKIELRHKRKFSFIGGTVILLVVLIVVFTVFRQRNSPVQQIEKGDAHGSIETIAIDNQPQTEIIQEIPNDPRIIPLDEQIRISNNNDYSDFATDGEYLYCSSDVFDYSSTPRILKIRLDDFSIEAEYETKRRNWDEMEPFHPSFFSLINGQLYFQDHIFETQYTINFKTGELKSLNFTSFFNGHRFKSDGEYFYAVGDHSNFDDFGIYKGKISTVLDTPRQIDAFTQITSSAIDSIYLHNEYLYAVGDVLTWNDVEIDNSGLWRTDLDGNNLIQIFDNPPNWIQFSEDRLFYSDWNSADELYLYSANLDGSDPFCYEDIQIKGPVNVCDKYIFYVHRYDNTIHRVNLDGTNDIQITSCSSNQITLIGDRIIYYNEDDTNYYITNLDGSSNCLLLELLANT